jgi:hypothetical protein
MTQTSKTVLIVLFTCLLFISSVVSQIKVSYHIGFIGTTGDTTAKLSEPVIIDYSKCYDITNGLARFILPKNGAFAIACNEAAPELELMVHAYPNPAVNFVIVRSLKNYPERGVVRYRVMLTDQRGVAVKQLETTLSDINSGFKIPLTDLAVGYFIVTLYADNEVIQSFKILKVS